jgi:hypothetical protein
MTSPISGGWMGRPSGKSISRDHSGVDKDLDESGIDKQLDDSDIDNPATAQQKPASSGPEIIHVPESTLD